MRSPDRRADCSAGAARRRAAALLLALALALPGTAWPYSLDHLLRLPIEQLLRIEVVLARGGLR